MGPPRQLKIDRLGPLTIPAHGLQSMAVRYGEDQFARYGRCQPTFLIAIKTDVLWLEALWEDHYERMLTYRLMTGFLKASGAHAYSYISEAYVAAYKPEDLGGDGEPDVLPANLPPDQREEVLFITSFDHKGQSFFSRYLITPRKRGLSFLGPRVDEEIGDMTGPALNLFKKAGPADG